MKLIILKGLLALTILATNSLIAHGQQSSSDSVTITRDQQRQCIKWYEGFNYYQDTVIPLKDSMIVVKTEFITYQEKEIEKRDRRIDKSKVKIKRSATIGTISGTILGVIITAITFGLVK